MNPRKSESQTLSEQALQSQGLLLLNDKLDTFLSKITESIANTHLSSQSHPQVARIEPSIRAARGSTMPYASSASSVDTADSCGSGSDGSPSSSRDDGHAEKRKRAPPIPGVRVPDLGSGVGAWKRAILQWEEGDLSRGLNVALKDWPKDWYTGDMKDFTSAKRGQRELVAKEYQRCVPDIQEPTRLSNKSAGLEVPMRHSWRSIQMQIRI
jgi:hypothetical protein